MISLTRYAYYKCVTKGQSVFTVPAAYDIPVNYTYRVIRIRTMEVARETLTLYSLPLEDVFARDPKS